MARKVNHIVKRVAKAVGVLALIAVAGLAVLLAALWVDHGRSTPLPAPSGPYKVGRTTYIWRDETRVNPYAPVAGSRQDLAVWIWYPAAPTSSTQKSEYLPGYWIRALEQHEGFILARLLSRDLTRVGTHSWTDAEVSSEQAMYPVIILRAGGGALSSDYTTLAEDLASHGYIVVSLDAPYRTVITAFPDGRVATRASGGDFDRMLPSSATQHLATQLMSVWIADLKFVLDQLLELNANDPTGRYRKLGVNFIEGYGMIETGITHVPLPGKFRVGFVGQASRDADTRISAEGEVQIRGPMNMLGYYRNAELTREAFTQDGYFRTGDRGEIDALGRLRLVGRLKEEFKTSKADMWRLRRSKNVSRYSRSLNRLRSSVPA
jgi:hypothetical protein